MIEAKQSTVVEATRPIREFGLWIGGEEVASLGEGRVAVINPATGQQWATLVDATREDVDRAVTSAAAAFAGPWRSSAAMRANAMLALADLME